MEKLNLEKIVDGEDFSNKEIIKLENYNKLREDYKKVIQNFNGICEVFDNKTPKNYPYADVKTSSRSIDKEYRDKKYISYISGSEIQYIFTDVGDIKDPNDPSKSGFDITKGFYKIRVIGAGSGGISYRYGNIYGSSSGNAGACCELYVYFPSNGHINGIIGNGSASVKLDRINNDNVYTVKGNDTEIYFNNNLIVKCCGGNGANIQQKKYITTYGGEYIEGKYIEKKIFGLKGGDSRGGDLTSEYKCVIVKDETPFNEYGIGGKSQTSNSMNNADNGQNGYFSIESIDPTEFGYLTEDIEIESDIIHTLGNENEIRRCFKNALNVIYNKLVPITHLVKDNCVEIGEETDEETNAKKYNEITNNEYYKLSEVKTSGESAIGFFRKDEYIITYDKDIKRKLSLKDWKDFNNNSMNQDYYTAYICNDLGVYNKIIYIKEIPNETCNIDVYNDKLNYLGIGNYRVYENEFFESRDNDIVYPTSGTTLFNGYATVSLVGAGGGGGGGSGGKHWYKSGSGGGSGAYLKALYKFKKGDKLRISIGKGGQGGLFRQRHEGVSGNPGNDTIFEINGLIFALSGAGGGGGGTTKHGSSGSTPCGNRGETQINNTDDLISIIENEHGNGNTPNEILYRQQDGMTSVYDNTNYGAGGRGGNNGKYPYLNNGLSGENGYGKLEVKREDELEYNGHLYTVYDNVNTISSVIYYSDYKYDLQKLNRLKEYVASKDNWFDNDGYCQRSCQVNCQTTVQKS